MASNQNTVNLKVDVGDRQYALDVPIGFSYLCGDSGTGKSQLIEDLYGTNVTIKLNDSELPFYPLSLRSVNNSPDLIDLNRILTAVDNKTRAVYFFNEDVINIIFCKDIVEKACAIPNACVVFISRTHMNKEVHGAHNSYELLNDRGGYSLKPYSALNVPVRGDGVQVSRLELERNESHTLTVYFGKQIDFQGRKDVITRPDITYKKSFKKEWYEDPFVQEILHDIDHIPEDSGPIIPWLIDHNRYPWDICTGSKNLIMAKYLEDKPPLMQYMGDNCFPYLMRIAQQQDITVYSSRLFWFKVEDWERYPIKVAAPQFNIIATNHWEFLDICADVVDEQEKYTGLGI